MSDETKPWKPGERVIEEGGELLCIDDWIEWGAIAPNMADKAARESNLYLSRMILIGTLDKA